MNGAGVFVAVNTAAQMSLTHTYTENTPGYKIPPVKNHQIDKLITKQILIQVCIFKQAPEFRSTLLSRIFLTCSNPLIS